MGDRTPAEWFEEVGRETEPWVKQFNEMITRVILFRKDLIDQVCLAALTDGRYGVLVTNDGVRIDRDVPAGQIYYTNDAMGAAGAFIADFRVPE